MINAIRRATSRKSIWTAVLSIAVCASAAAQTATTAFGRQMEKVDLGISAIGEFTPTTTDPNYTNQTVSSAPSNTLGTLIELRYIKSPRVGFEFNYSYARYNDTINIAGGILASQPPYVLGVQSKVNEYTFGYVAHGPTFGNLKTFGSIGAGGIAFKPTSGGGIGLPEQLRSAFYYSVGVEQGFSEDRYGVRVFFRQTFFGTPDFNQIYIATDARSITTQPGIGFWVRF